MRRKALFSFAGICAGTIILGLAYNNCTAPKIPQKPKTIYVTKLDDQSLDILAEVSLQDRETLCDSANWKCTQFIYSPGLKDKMNSAEFCSEDLCFTVKTITYNSSRSPMKHDYEEAYCTNLRANELIGKEMQIHADSLDEAISKSLKSCADWLRE